MKIKSIKLHNFMRYKGDNELQFSTDDEKNVTVVLGDNTFGKTTLAQAFRWTLYEKLNDTSYTKRKDVVLLNNEAAAEMRGSSSRDVYVEIQIIHDKQEFKFVRKALFNKKTGNINDISVKQVGPTQLTMQIKNAEGVWGDVIDNSGQNINSKKYKAGCVQEAIDNMFPPNLSNYFFFDGERWNDLKSKKDDIKKSVDTILGLSGLAEMMNHLKDHRASVARKFRGNLSGTSGEYERLQREITGLEASVEAYEQDINAYKKTLESLEEIIRSTDKILNDNRKVEEDQKRLNTITRDIQVLEKMKADSYANIVKELSNSAKLFASSLLSEFAQELEKIDLEGKDIPGVTVDTLNYLLDTGICLCGTELKEGSEAYNTMINLKKQVPPEMLGGAAGKLKATLESWEEDTKEMVSSITDQANGFDLAQMTIDEKTYEKESLERTIDRKTNLGPVRTQNSNAKKRKNELLKTINTYEIRLDQVKKNIDEKNKQLDAVAEHDKRNEYIYRCLAYVDALYEKAQLISNQRKTTTITDLNERIGDNFQKMFNDREKYAKLGEDYKIHVYYHKVGNMTNYEEEHLSNGETIAINFVYIVSILELAKQYRELERENKDYGMENAILGIPLVLDGPFSALSNENTSLVASKLPEFAEQVIIFMLDKDWEASGLEKYTLPEYCYRVNKEATSNSSTLVLK